MPSSVLTSAPGTAKKSSPAAAIMELLESNAALLISIGIAAVYIPLLLRSFWVDEAGTYWMACRGHLAAIQRTSHWPGQSILYAAIASFFCFDGSPLRDLLLRIPSLLATAAAGYFIYRYAEDAFGAGAGRIAAVLFAFSPSTVDFATQARPYAFAMAAAAASCWTLYRWAGFRERRWLAGYVISSALLIYFHYLFAVIFAAHAVLLLYEVVLKRRFSRSWELLVGCAAAALLVIPIVPHIVLLLHESHTLPVGPKPSALALAEILMPALFTAGAVASGLLVHFARPDVRRGVARRAPGTAAMLLIWWSLGPVLLFVVSSTTTMQMFVERYLAYSGMALVLLLTYAGYSLFGPRAGLIWTLPLVLLIAGNGLRIAAARQPGEHELGPFMSAIRDESARTKGDVPPVLFQSMLVESDFYDWRSGNSPGSYLFTPFAAYPMKNDLVPLPFRLTAEARDYVEHLLERDLKDKKKVIFVPHDFPWIEWVTRRFTAAGFTYRYSHLNDYWVFVFERPVH